MSRRRGQGFTLIEVLVSVVLMAVLAALCYQALNYVRAARETTAAAFERIRAVEMAVHFLTTDFEQLEPRPVRDLLGATSIPALLADGRSKDLVVLTRGGWPNPAGLPRGTLQRVTYTLDNGTLVRQYPTVLDATLANTPVRRELLKDVTAIRIRYMDQTRQWQDQWPPLAASSATNALPLSTRPLAVEITLETKDLGQVVRLVEIAS
jgi:general secretion pathway protein J